MEKMLNYLKRAPEMAGVEIYLLQQGKMRIRYAMLRQKGNRVLYNKGEYHLESLNDLKHAIGEHIPMVISVNGQGIIHRSFSTTLDTQKDEYARKIFPNTALDDFYVQESRGQDWTFISMVRRDIINDLVRLFEDLSIRVFSISLGPFAIRSLLPHSEAPAAGEFRLDGHQFKIDKGELTDYQAVQAMVTESKKTTLAGEELNECLAIAYATALCYMANLPFPHIRLDQLDVQRDEYFHQGMFKKLAISMMALFLLALLLNAFFYYRYSSTLLPDQNSQLESLKKEEEALKLVLANQLAIDGRITRPTNAHYGSLSRVADLLAANVPGSITLNEMAIFPADKELSRKERRPVYDFNRISLQGNCETGKDLNRWLSDIRHLDFCRSVEIKEYSSVSTSTSEFRIELAIE